MKKGGGRFIQIPDGGIKLSDAQLLSDITIENLSAEPVFMESKYALIIGEYHSEVKIMNKFTIFILHIANIFALLYIHLCIRRID